MLFLASALSLAGIPPLSGFVAKLALVNAGLDAGQYAIVAVSLAVSLLTLFSMTKIWSSAFWGEPRATDEIATSPPVGRGSRGLMVWSTAALVGVSLAIAVWAGPIYDLSERAARDLIDPTSYTEAVLGS